MSSDTRFLPRRALVRISFAELGRMVSLAQWENQALMGYIKKYVPFTTVVLGLGSSPSLAPID